MMKVVREFEYRSKSNPDRKPYVTKVYSDGTMSCDCRGWTMKKVDKPRGCTHTKRVVKMLASEGEIVSEAPVVKELPSDFEKLPVMRPNDGTLEHMKNPDTIVQLKCDGTYSFLIKEGDKVTMPGRSFKSDYTANHPEFVRDAMKVPLNTYTLAGELVFVDSNGQDHFLTALAKEETWLELGYTPKYIVFDILQYQGQDVTDRCWAERNTILKSLFRDTQFEGFELIESYDRFEDKQEAWERSNEGIVIKDIHSTITDGRTNKWRKVKKIKAEDFWAIGLTKGTGAREVTFGAMMLANKVGDSYEYITKTSGFTNAQLVHFLDTLIRNDDLPVTGNLPTNMMYLTNPVLVEIKYQRKTRTGSLIMPRFVKERMDIQ